MSTAEQESLEKPLQQVKTVSEWMSEALEAAKPISKVLGEAAEWSSTLKAASKLMEKATKESSPHALGWLACTLAYRKAAGDAVRLFGRPALRVPYAREIVLERLKNLRLEDPWIMEGFSIDNAASHPFLRAADQALVITLEAAGYDASERRRLLRTVRSSFKRALQDVLSAEHREKFTGFTQWMKLDADDGRLSRNLLAYADQQRADLWAPLLFKDEELPQERSRRDPVLPARSSESTQAKKRTHQTADGLPIHSFPTLLADLATPARVTYSLKTDNSGPTFQQVPPPTPLQAKAYELLNLLPVAGD